MEQNTQGSSFPKVSGALDKISYKVMLLLAFVLPLFVIPVASFPFQFGKVIVASLVALLIFSFWIISRLRSGNIDLPKGIIFGASGLIVASGLVSTLFSGAIGESFIGVGSETNTFFFTLILFVLMFVSFKMFTKRSRVLNFYLALFASSAMLVIYQLLRVFFGADFLSFEVLGRPTSALVGRWNDLAIFTGLSAFISVVTLEFFRPSKQLKMLLYISMFLSVLFMFFVNSFTAWMVLAISSLVLLVYLFFRSDRGRETESKSTEMTKPKRAVLLSKLTLLLFILAVLAMIFRGQIGDFVVNRFALSQIEARPSFRSTLDIAKNVLVQSPGFGAGPNRFAIEWGLNKPIEVNNSIFWNVNFNSGFGVVPSTLVTNGVLGFVSWVILLGAILLLGIKVMFSEIKDNVSRFVAVSSFLASLFLWIFSVISVPGPVVMVLTFIMTGIFLASASNMGYIKSRRIHFADNSRIGFVSVFVMILVLILNVGFGYLISTRYMSSVYAAQAVSLVNVDGDLEAGLNKMERALSLAKIDGNYRLMSQLHIARLNAVLSQADLAGTEEGTAQFQAILGEAILNAQYATEVDSADYNNWLALGNIYEALVPLEIPGAYENARAIYQRAEVANPTNPSVNLALARLEVANGDNDLARANIGRSLQKKNNYTGAIFLLSQIEIADGNITGAIQAIEAASTINPNDSLTFFQLGFLKFNQGDNEGAITALERAVVINSQYSNARYFLGLSYYNVGKVQSSISEFEAIEVLNPNNVEVQEILSNLRAGNPPITPPSAATEREELPVEEI